MSKSELGVSLACLSYVRSINPLFFAAKAFQEIVTLNINKIELPLWSTITREEITQLTRILREYNIHCSTIHLPKSAMAMETKLSPLLVEAVISIMPEVIVLHPQAGDSFIYELEKLVRHINKAGIKLSLEYLNYSINPIAILSTLKMGIGLTVDFHHCMAAGQDIVSFIEHNSDLIMNVHIRDFSPENPGSYIKPGQGVLDMKKIFECFNKCNYSGDYFIECPFSSRQELSQTINYVRQTLYKEIAAYEA